MAEFKPFEMVVRIEYGGATYDGDATHVCMKPTFVQPLVRCKDCKYCYAEGFVNERNVCEKHYDFGNVDDNWFCADGERRSDEDQHIYD